MSFFTNLVNVEEHFQKINEFIGETKFPKDKMNSIKYEIKLINYYIKFITKKHKSINPDMVAKLISIKDQLNKSRGLSLLEFRTEFLNITKEFEAIFDLTPVYLMRHPEKPKEKTRHLSFGGVRQAKGVAEYLAEECLLCSKPVHVYLFCSDERRTYLFANVIQRKLEQLTKFYDKKIKIEKIAPDPALYFRFTNEAINETLEEYKQSDFLAFTTWIKGKYKLCPNPIKVIKELDAWVKTSKAKSNNREWTIVVGISHSFIIDALLSSITKEHKSIISTAGFAKFRGNQMFYDNKWYNFG